MDIICLSALCRNQPVQHAEAAGFGSDRHVIRDGSRHVEEAPGHRGSERWGASARGLTTGSDVVFSKVDRGAVPQMLTMMVDLEEDDEWAMADELEDDDFDR